ncbi:MAG: ABC transporter substrate-binding protein [Microthrixaceae bacterium]
MRRLLALATLCATVALLGSACSSDDGSDTTVAPKRTTSTTTTVPITANVKVGALLDLSGPGKSLGEASRSALEAGVKVAAARGVGVELDIRDTGSDPATAQKEIESLQAAGVSAVIGPQTSAEATQILPFANEKGMLLVSQASTASSLAIADDALYRMVPTDETEGAASGDLMTAGGPTRVVLVHRNDPGNNGLFVKVRSAVAARKGSPIIGPSYPADGADYVKVAKDIADKVTAAGAGQPLVVYVAGFDEVADILAAASKEPALAATPFYGADGSARSAAVTGNAVAAGFAAGPAKGFASPLPTVGADAADTPRELTEALPEPNPLAYAAFDALVAVAQAAKDAPAATGPQLRAAFVTAAGSQKGVTGAVAFDPAGDRTPLPYAYWGVCKGSGDGFEWRNVGTWEPPATAGEAGKVTTKGCS